MADRHVFRGIYPALVSPVDGDGSVREKPLRDLVRWHLSCGVQGLYVCGGTGEGIILPYEARAEILSIVLDEVRTHGDRTRHAVIAHVGAADARTVSRLVRHAADSKADAVSSVPPLYYAYGQEGVRRYYEWLAAESGLPVIIYASAQSGVVFSAAALRELAQNPRIVGIKFTGYNLYELMKYRSATAPDFTIVNGADEILMYGLLAGADGGIGTTYNVVPREVCGIYQACLAGDVAEARRLQARVNAVVDVVVHANVIGSVKHILGRLGFDVGEAAFPLNTLGAADREWIDLQLKDLRLGEDRA